MRGMLILNGRFVRTAALAGFCGVALAIVGCDETAPEVRGAAGDSPGADSPGADSPGADSPGTDSPGGPATDVRRACEVRAPATAVVPLPAEQSATVGKTFRDCAECPLMIEAPTGTYVRGSPPDEGGRIDDEGPQREITIAYRLAVGVHEVTFAEWDACVAGGGCDAAFDMYWGRGQRPVILVSWVDAQAYVTWVSTRTGRNYRLLSEAEWEYVTRGRHHDRILHRLLGLDRRGSLWWVPRIFDPGHSAGAGGIVSTESMGRVRPYGQRGGVDGGLLL